MTKKRLEKLQEVLDTVASSLEDRKRHSLAFEVDKISANLLKSKKVTAAMRPSRSVISGELDNTVKGKITGYMLFQSTDGEPKRVEFKLTGNAGIPLLGNKIKITPKPATASDVTHLAEIQNGKPGAMGTYSSGHFDGWYLEWYSEENGRVVVELPIDRVHVVDQETKNWAKEFVQKNASTMDPDDLMDWSGLYDVQNDGEGDWSKLSDTTNEDDERVDWSGVYDVEDDGHGDWSRVDD